MQLIENNHNEGTIQNDIFHTNIVLTSSLPHIPQAYNRDISIIKPIYDMISMKMIFLFLMFVMLCC